MATETLKRLSKIFTVGDLMTDVKQLKRADTIENARNLFNEYDVVPYPKTGEIKGYFYHKNKGIKDIVQNTLISDGTSIFDLINLLNLNQFYFILSTNNISGYIHFSDLNKPYTKIPLYVMFEAFERRLWEKLKDRIKEEHLNRIFQENEVNGFLRKKKFNVKRNIDIGWAGIFTFPYILRLARFYGLSDLIDQDIKLLKETRNKLAHSGRNLVNSYNDVKRLIEAQELCLSMIK